MKAERVSSFKWGDRVETTRPCTDHSWGGRMVPAATRGTLGHMHRVQDGIECWTLWLDESIEGKRLLGVAHTSVRKLP